MAADRLVTEQAAAEEAARVAAEEAARLATEQAAAEEAARVAAGPPPHLPPAREVKVHEFAMRKWRECGGAEIEAALKTGAVALLDAGWVIALAASGGVLLPRQALPDEAFILLTEIQRATDHHYKNINVVCVSHCWLQPDHPDPRGYNLRAVARALASLALHKRFGVFLDFCSMHQNCRNRDGVPQDTAFAWLEKGGFADGAVGRFPAENALFTQALGSLGTFYSHPHTHVLMLTDFPPDYFTDVYTHSGNTKEYFDRGWCFCESSWAAMVKYFDLVLDLGKDTGEGKFDAKKCMQGRKAPLLPKEFAEQLKTKGFTNGSDDRPLVAGLYSKGFEERFGAVIQLSYVNLGWGDEGVRALALVLPHARVLQELYLGNNLIGNAGARALAEALPLLPALKQLYLNDNSIGDEGARALAEALPRVQALWKINLKANSIGDAAKAELKTACDSRNMSLIFTQGQGVAY